MTRAPADVGLHRDLTDQPPLSAAARRAWASARRRSGSSPAAAPPAAAPDAVAGRDPRPVRRLEGARGDAPGPFSNDGHQHVHVLPGVREALVAESLVPPPARPQVGARLTVEPSLRCP